MARCVMWAELCRLDQCRGGAGLKACDASRHQLPAQVCNFRVVEERQQLFGTLAAEAGTL